MTKIKNRNIFKYWDGNNFYGWAMLQKFPVNNSEWIEDTSQFDEDFIKSCSEEGDKGYFFKVDVQYPKKLYELHNDLAFLPARMKTEKVEKFVTNLHDKTEYVIRLRNLKEALNRGLVVKNVHRVIKFDQNA